MKMSWKNLPDYSKIENQVGCGYCKLEKLCPKHDAKTNFAKLGCEFFIHFLKSKKVIH